MRSATHPGSLEEISDGYSTSGAAQRLRASCGLYCRGGIAAPGADFLNEEFEPKAPDTCALESS